MQKFAPKITRGFTLIELLIYSGMLTILLTVFTAIFGWIVDAQLDLDATSSVQQDNQYISTKLSQDIMKADTITTPSAASMGVSSTSLQLSINSVVYTYSVDASGNLIVSTPSGSDALNSFQTSISDVYFTRIGNAGGKNTIVFTYKVTGRTTKTTGVEEVTATSAAALR